MQKLFVYGTLLRGEKNHSRLDGAKFVREAVTEAKYEMYHNGLFPAITTGDHQIYGEIYEIPDNMWDILDKFEGTGGGFYARIKDRVGGVDCNLYLGGACLKYTDLPVPSGDYRKVLIKI